MSESISSAQLDSVASVSAAPARTKVDRNFGLPNGLYAATVGLYLVFLAVMSALFMNSGLVMPMAVIVGFVIFAFAVAGKWASMGPTNDTQPLSWGQFANRGVQTLSGPLSVSEASVQVLILPVLIVVWGLAIAVIVAFT